MTLCLLPNYVIKADVVSYIKRKHTFFIPLHKSIVMVKLYMNFKGLNDYCVLNDGKTQSNLMHTNVKSLVLFYKKNVIKYYY